jgi:hypothetical protein
VRAGGGRTRAGCGARDLAQLVLRERPAAIQHWGVALARVAVVMLSRG